MNTFILWVWMILASDALYGEASTRKVQQQSVGKIRGLQVRTDNSEMNILDR